MSLGGAAPETNRRSDSLREIRDSVAAVAPRGSGLTRIRALRFTPLGYDPKMLALMGEMGWIALMVPEDQGGSGLGAAELCVICEELGAGLAPEPLIQACLSADILACCKSSRLPSVSAGSVFAPVAWQESADTLEVSGDERASRQFVASARGATGFLIPVRRGSVFDILHCEAGSVLITAPATQDGGHYGKIEFDLARAETVGTIEPSALDRALDVSALATSAYLVGVMAAAFALTLAYLKMRTQFGRPIGSFQAMQHRAVELKTRLELTRASVKSAAEEFDRDAFGALGRKAVSRAKASASDAAMLITRQSIQMHGAIGFTDEYDAGLYLRKAMVLAGQLGSARYHRGRFLRLDETSH